MYAGEVVFSDTDDMRTNLLLPRGASPTRSIGGALSLKRQFALDSHS